MSLEQPPPGHRASDNDRERAAAVVQEAHSDGRLDFEELDERLTRIYSAKTQSELEVVTADLEPVRSRSNAAELAIKATHSSQKREGAWLVPQRIVAQAKHSSVRLDFTDAVVRWPEIQVEADLVHSSIVMIVPTGWTVTIDDVELHGGSANNKATAASPSGRHIFVTGKALYSSMTVRHPRKRHWWWPWYRK
ncbi:DUF1707 domain-containing protein [Kribbella sp. NPDC026596]|uniref:DUF1707 SHOCT-like domain-containing protein n=1 Tax=Kribbella sp. NPDC026596 TaxID=3155122 RepID=UPI0033E51937